MAEATIETPAISPTLVVKPELPSADGKANSLIAMRDLWKTYDMGAEKVHALHGVSFDVRRGERSEEHTSELQSLAYLVCRLLLEKKKKTNTLTAIHGS